MDKLKVSRHKCDMSDNRNERHGFLTAKNSRLHNQTWPHKANLIKSDQIWS